MSSRPHGTCWAFSCNTFLKVKSQHCVMLKLAIFKRTSVFSRECYINCKIVEHVVSPAGMHMRVLHTWSFVLCVELCTVKKSRVAKEVRLKKMLTFKLWSFHSICNYLRLVTTKTLHVVPSQIVVLYCAEVMAGCTCLCATCLLVASSEVESKFTASIFKK